MNKIGAYIVANNQGGYDVIEKTSQTSSKPFIIPQEEIPNEKQTQENKSKDFTITKSYPFEDAKTGSVSLPEWMQTKTEPKRSDEEILKDIEELAKENARTGKFQDSDPRFRELMDEYVSSVSPDRESILKNSVSEINERIAMEIQGIYGMINSKEKENKKEPIDYFIEMLRNNGKAKDMVSSKIATIGNNISSSLGGESNIIDTRSDGYYTAVDIDRGGGKVTTLVYDNQGNVQPWMQMKGNMYSDVSIMNGKVENAIFNDSNGELIMLYSNGNDNKDGISQITTSAEHTRRKEIQAVYNAVYDFSVGRYGRYNPHEEIKLSSTILTNVNGIGNTNALIKEVYDSTYERLKSEAALAT